VHCLRAALVLALAACSSPTRAPVAAHTTIGGSVVARVGNVSLPVTLVAAVAAARGISPPQALALLIDDAVAANGAQAEHLDTTAYVTFSRLAATSRATIDHIRAVTRGSPPTDDELRAVTAVHWLEVDTPPTFVVVHAVALRPKTPDPRAEAAAKAVAGAIASAELSATDANDFAARANAVPHAGVKLVIEALEPFTADGRVAVPGAPSSYDPRFVAAATALTAPGATSGVVESSFGWHVIRLLARRPAVTVPVEARRRMFADEVYAHRARHAVDELESALRARESATLANGVDDILALAVPATPSSEPTSTPAAAP
jgi:hypothetical protein